MQRSEVTMGECRDCSKPFETDKLSTCLVCRVGLCFTCLPTHTCDQADIDHWKELVRKYPEFYGPIHKGEQS